MKVILPKLPEYPWGVILEFKIVPCGWREFVTDAAGKPKVRRFEGPTQRYAYMSKEYLCLAV